MKKRIASFPCVSVCSFSVPRSALGPRPDLRRSGQGQEAIERVYYSHQIGATKPFEKAVPRAVLEEKVRKYLQQTVALEVYWKTRVTDEMLERELERMVQGPAPGPSARAFRGAARRCVSD